MSGVDMASVKGQFTEYQRRKGLTERTVEAREMILTRFTRFLSPRCYWEATPHDVELFAPTSHPKTRDWYLSNLAAFYQWAIKHDLTGVDPTLKVDRPRLPRYEPRPAKRSHIRQALDAADARLACMIALAAYVGLRCKDMSGLQTEDVDLEEGWVYVSEGKGGHQRYVPIPHEAVPYLEAWRPEGWLFPSERGGHLFPNSISKTANNHFRACGLPCRMHMLRHTYGTTMGEQDDMKIEVLSKLMGHASVATTQTYRRVSRRELETVRGLSLSAP